MKKLRVRVSDEITDADLKRIKEINIMKARAACRPFSTYLDVAIRARLTVDFVKKNWDEIFKY